MVAKHTKINLFAPKDESKGMINYSSNKSFGNSPSSIVESPSQKSSKRNLASHIQKLREMKKLSSAIAIKKKNRMTLLEKN